MTTLATRVFYFVRDLSLNLVILLEKSNLFKQEKSKGIFTSQFMT